MQNATPIGDPAHPLPVFLDHVDELRASCRSISLRVVLRASWLRPSASSRRRWSDAPGHDRPLVDIFGSAIARR
jgi:hypothetical protein